MKPIFYFLLCILLAGCGKDSEADRQDAEIADAAKVLLGAWEFNRMAIDPEFKNLVNPKYPEDVLGSYIMFDAEGKFTDFWPSDKNNPETNGRYALEFREEFMTDRGGSGPVLHLVSTNPPSSMFHITPDGVFWKAILDTFSKNRLVFYVIYWDGKHEFYVYSEFLRKW